MELAYLCLWALVFLPSFVLGNQMESRIDLDTDDAQAMQYEYLRLLYKGLREEQYEKVMKILKKDTYEKQRKLIEESYRKIFELIKNANQTMSALDYRPTRDDFPMNNPTLLQAVMFTLSGCCGAAENLLRIPDISQDVLREIEVYHWKHAFKWCIELLQSYPKITDADTPELVAVLRQEISTDAEQGLKKHSLLDEL